MMAYESNSSRLLLYVPIAHSREDMGCLADRLPDSRSLSQTISEDWRAVADRIRGLPVSWTAAKIYQDGMPDSDPELVHKIIEEDQNTNTKLLGWLMGQGARVLGTESPVLLKQEVACLDAIFNAKDCATLERARNEYARRAPTLLKARDQYIAHRIDATLAPEEIGVLFIGKAHRVAQELPQDIQVCFLNPRGASEIDAARDGLVAHHLPLVRRLCRRFINCGEPMEDLVQVGSIGLIKAIKKYDPNRGSVFIAFAVPLILGEVKNYFRDHGWAIKVPRKIQRQKLLVRKTVESLSQELDRSPTIQEIAESTGFSEEDVYDTFEVVKCGKPLSLEAEHDKNGNGDVSRLQDYLASTHPQMKEVADRIDLINALDCLNEREKTIIYSKFYADLSETKIAERLGISQMHVSRLLRNSLRKLKLNLLN